MKNITKLTIWVGSIISVRPYIVLNHSDLGLLLMVFFFGLTIILSDLAFESRKGDKIK